MKIAGVLLALAAAPAAPMVAGAQQDGPEAYRTVLIQAAPGRLLDLIDLLKARLPVYAAAGEPAPLLARHSQGDHWDLLLLEPVGSVRAFYSAEREARWARAAAEAGLPEDEFGRRLEPLVAWREELFVAGPPRAEFEAQNAGAGFYHLEMFQGLAGLRDSLVRQRQMENQYLAAIGRRPNLVFTRLAGAATDVFTVGFYRDLQDYAAPPPAALTPEADNAAAVGAGFESRNHIGLYLRRFLASHHDTLLNRVR